MRVLTFYLCCDSEFGARRKRWRFQVMNVIADQLINIITAKRWNNKYGITFAIRVWQSIKRHWIPIKPNGRHLNENFKLAVMCVLHVNHQGFSLGKTETNYLEAIFIVVKMKPEPSFQVIKINLLMLSSIASTTQRFKLYRHVI